MGAKYNNYCKNGNCSGCGNCCTELIPLTITEVNLIKAYIKEKGVKPYSEVFFDYNGKPSANLMCPFRDFDKQVCKIYPVRPKICRVFKCNQDLITVEKHKDSCHKKANYNKTASRKKRLTKVYSTRELIYGDKLDTLRLIIGNILRDTQRITVEEVMNMMTDFQREDLADRDLIKKVIEEYKEFESRSISMEDELNGQS
jgi:Fe-S-cluster containining protein